MLINFALIKKISKELRGNLNCREKAKGGGGGGGKNSSNHHKNTIERPCKQFYCSGKGGLLDGVEC